MRAAPACCSRSAASCCCSRAISRSVAFSPAWRSVTSSCSAVIVPSCASRVTASCTCARGTRSSDLALPCAPWVVACTDVAYPPSETATCTARFTEPEMSVTRSERLSPTTTARFGVLGTASAPGCRVRVAAPCASRCSRTADVCPCGDGRVKTTAAATAAATGTATTSARRHVKRRGGAGASAAIRRMRSRTCGGASTRAARSSATRSRCDMEGLLELLERAVQARGAVGGGDSEDAGRGTGIEVEKDAERDHLALARRQPRERRLEVGRQALGEAEVDRLGRRRELLAAEAAALRPEVVERDRPRHLAEPRARRPACGVEPVPEPERALERHRRQLLGREAVPREPREVSVDVVEVRLRRLLERHLG